MSETGATQQQSRPLGKRLRHGFESKVLVPLAATVVSAATSYLIRKLPMIIEEHVLPRLREPGGAEAMRDAFVEKAEAVVQGAAAIVPDEQASGAGGEQGSDEATAEAKTSSDGDGSKTADAAETDDEQSNEQREEERRQREERRAERKRSLQRA